MPGYRVLVIDDETLLLRMLDCAFRVLGCEMVGASTLADGVREASGQGIDFILLDNHFPEGHSDSIVPALIASNPHTPLVMITGNELDGHVANSLRLGVLDVLHKPFSLDELAATMVRYSPAFPGRLPRVA